MSADPDLDLASDPAQVARTILLDKLSGQPRTRAESDFPFPDAELLRDELERPEAEVGVMVGGVVVRGVPTVHSGRSAASPGLPNQSGPLEPPPDSADPAELRVADPAELRLADLTELSVADSAELRVADLTELCVAGSAELCVDAFESSGAVVKGVAAVE